MGIGGHILGDKKLRRLARLTGLPLDRAYIRNHDCEGVVWSESGCTHYLIDLATGAAEAVDPASHWTTCNPANRH